MISAVEWKLRGHLGVHGSSRVTRMPTLHVGTPRPQSARMSREAPDCVTGV